MINLRSGSILLPSNSLRDTWTLYVDGRVFNLGDFTPDPNDNNYLKFTPSPRIPVWGTAGGKVLFTLQAPRPPVWSGTMTTVDLSQNGSSGFGCEAGAVTCSQALTGSHAFTYGGTSYAITTLKVDGGVLTFATSPGTSGLQHLTLNVDGTAFALADAASDQWSNSGLSWSAGDTVQLSLSGPPPTGVELSAESLAVTEGGTGTFTVALTADPGADKTVQLVRTRFWQSAGEPGHVWDQGAATLSPTSLTFTAGSSGNWATPQAVTVTGAEDPDTADQQLMVLVLEGSQSGDYRPVRGSGHNAVSGVHVTVADSGVNFVIEPPTGVQAHAGRALSYDSHGNDLGRWLARFSWEAPGGSQTVTGYDLQWRREGGAWPVGVTSLSASDTSRIIRPNLGDRVNQSRGTVLGYRVRTRTADGASPWIEGTLTLDNPANLVRNLGVYASGQGELFASWASNDDWPAEDFDVQYKVTGASNWMSSDPEKGWVDAGYSGGTDELMTIQNLKDGTTYQVRVRAKSDWDFTWVVAEGTTSGTAPSCDGCGREGDLGFVRDPNAPENPNADLIADVKEWRDDPRYVSDKNHTDRWDRVLLTLGEAVSDQTLQPMTATEAQGYADRGWTRWTAVAETLAEIEAAAQQQDPPSTGPSQDPPDAPNDAPTVVHSPGDVTIGNEHGSKAVPLYTLVDDASLSSTLVSMFHDGDGDDLTITASSSNESVATVSVSGHTATVSARSRGAATITVTADDGRGGTVSDDFAVTVKSAPTVESAIGDVSGLEAGTTREISLSGVFSDADGDDLTITASALDDRVARVTAASDGSALTVTGVSAGATTITVVARDTNGNRVAERFDVSVEASQPRLLTPPTQQQPPRRIRHRHRHPRRRPKPIPDQNRRRSRRLRTSWTATTRTATAR